MQIPTKMHKQSAPVVGLSTTKHNILSNPLKPILNNTPHQHKLTHRLATEPIRQDPHWQFIESRRESHLNSLFNRRKTILESISKKNKQIYQRIQHQQSHYHNKANSKQICEKLNSIQNLTNGSRILLALSRQALNSSKNQQQQSTNRTSETVNDENRPQEVVKALIFKRLSRPKEEPLATIEQYPRAKVVESRLIETGRLNQTRSVQLDCAKVRACSVGRRRLQDVFTNF